jgi:hypothetical protein
MVRTCAVPWFARLVRLTVLWCLSGMLFVLRPVTAPTYPVWRRPGRQVAPDNTNKGTQ